MHWAGGSLCRGERGNEVRMEEERRGLCSLPQPEWYPFIVKVLFLADVALAYTYSIEHLFFLLHLSCIIIQNVKTFTLYGEY